MSETQLGGATPLEIRLEDGRSATLTVPAPADPAIGGFAFGVYKAGSTLLQLALLQICGRTGIPIFCPITEGRQAGGIAIEIDPLTAQTKRDFEAAFARKGIVFAGFRDFPHFLKLDVTGRQATLLVRDPRDMLVSQYFSLLFSHVTGPGFEKVSTLRKKHASTPIDEFVIGNAKIARNWFKNYDDNIGGANLLLHRYEDIIFDKARFLTEVCAHLGIDTERHRAVILDVAQAVDERPAEEDPYKHVRRVTPGDHREKLRPETIERLNEIVGPILDQYGYPR